MTGADRENLLKAQQAAASFAQRSANDTRRMREILDGKMKSLKDENNRLRELLEKYGGHKLDCRVMHPTTAALGKQPNPCTCGFSEALAAEKPAEKPVPHLLHPPPTWLCAECRGQWLAGQANWAAEQPAETKEESSNG